MSASTFASTSPGPGLASPTTATDDSILPAFNAWRRALASLTGLGLTEEEQASRQAGLTAEKQSADCKRCIRWRDQVIAESPIVRFMLGHIDSLPGTQYQQQETQPENTPANSPVPIFCTPCGPDRSGGFAPGLGVVLCQDRLMGKNHVEDVLAHELIHEWDNRRFDVDWSNLRHLACSEIRAASLSGDCRWGRELKRRNFSFTKQHQECTKRRAVLSVMQHPALAQESSLTVEGKKQEAERLVNEVWQSCWKDTRPFDEIY